MTAAAAFLLLGGCGGAVGPQTFPVSGTVTRQGNPIAVDVGEVQLTFHPTGESKSAHAVVDSEGSYSLRAVPGTYVVTLEYFDPDVLPGTESERSPIPRKYTQRDTSPLKVEVTEGDNAIDLKLEG